MSHNKISFCKICRTSTWKGFFWHFMTFMVAEWRWGTQLKVRSFLIMQPRHYVLLWTCRQIFAQQAGCRIHYVQSSWIFLQIPNRPNGLAGYSQFVMHKAIHIFHGPCCAGMLTERLSEAGFEVQDRAQNETELAWQMLIINKIIITTTIII